MNTTPNYQPRLRAPSARAKVWLAVVGLFAPVIILIATVLMIATSSSGEHIFVGDDAWFTALTLVGSMTFCIAVFLLMRYFMARRSLDLADESLTVTTSFYRRRIAISDIDLATARVIDFNEKTELKPLFKTNGFALPGYQSGWFRTRSLKSALVAILSGPKVLWLPTRLGYEVLLEVEQPQQLLEALKERAGQQQSSRSSATVPQANRASHQR